MPYIPERALSNLKYYKYSGKDLSYVSYYIMQYWWSGLVQFVPHYVAPNMLTAIGFLFSITPVLVVMLTAWDPATYQFDGANVPSSAWYFAGVCTFVYQTLDAMDGKHARRTKSSSPLGELFDHGCDSFFCPSLQIIISICIGLDGWQRLAYWGVVSTGMFMALWEQYSTGTLDLWYINGPVEGLLMTVAAFIWTGYAGAQWWGQPFSTPLAVEVAGVSIAITNVREVLFTFVVLMGVATALNNFRSVLFVEKYANATVTPWVALLAHATAAALFGYVAHAYADLLKHVPYAVELGYGLLCSVTVTRMTLSRLCQFRFNSFGQIYMLALLIYGTAAAATLPALAKSPLPGLVAQYLPVATVAFVVVEIVKFGHMAISVFVQMAKFLGIRTLHLTDKQIEVARQELCPAKSS